MSRRSRFCALACGAVAGVIAAGAPAQSHPIYRYIDPDGTVHYADQAPPATAKGVEVKRLTLNYIETDESALVVQKAQNRYPVTLYTFACGDVCDRAVALLNRRGVPFATVNVNEADGQEKLKRLTGELRAPVLQAGDTLMIKGFSEAEWQALLDRAGYPKTPPTRRAAASAEAVAAAQAARAAPQAIEAGQGGYPKN